MPNRIKYNKTGSEANSVFKGNWAIDHRFHGGGPTGETGIRAGATIPAGGYAFYGPGEVARTLENDAELLVLVGNMGGDNSSVNAAFQWAASQDNIIILKEHHEEISTDGLVLNFDPYFSKSTRNLATNSLPSEVGAPTLSNEGGGSFNFDGTNDGFLIDCEIDMRNDFTITVVFYYDEYESSDADELGSVAGTERDGGVNINRQTFLASTKFYWGGDSSSKNGFWIGWGGANSDDNLTSMLWSFQANSLYQNHVYRQFDGNPGRWNEVTVVKSGSQFYTWINGEMTYDTIWIMGEGYQPTLPYVVNTDSHLAGQIAIGGGNLSKYSNSKIGLVRAWNRALADEEITNHHSLRKFKAFTAHGDTDLLIHWNAEDQRSTSYNSETFEVTSVNDVSISSHNATITPIPPVYEVIDGIPAWKFGDAITETQYFNFTNVNNNGAPDRFSGSTLSLEATIRAAAEEVTSGDRGTIIVGNAYMSWNKTNQRMSTYWYSTTNKGYHELGPALNREEWYHWMNVWTGSELIQYIDGVEVGRVNTTINEPSTFNRFRIGAENLPRQFHGHINRVRAWNRAMTADEVYQLGKEFKNRIQ